MSLAVVVILADTLLAACAGWVLWCSVTRIRVMRWGTHQCLQIAAYLLLALWSLLVLLPPPDNLELLLGFDPLRVLGPLGVAVLFVAGRKRWLGDHAPADVLRSTAAEKDLQATLLASTVSDGDVLDKRARASAERQP